MSGRMVQVLAVALSALSGFVDVLGYLSLGGVFVSFMSGNSTVLGATGAAGIGSREALAAGVVTAFVAGVMAGTWIGRPFAARRPPVVLLLVAAVLTLGAVLHLLGQTVASGIIVAAAMGAENTTFQKDGQAGMGLTYMTGTLVRLGQRVAEAIIGASWRPVLPDLLLWGGMVAGAFLGAAAFSAMGLNALWIAVAAVLVLAGIARANLP